MDYALLPEADASAGSFETDDCCFMSSLEDIAHDAVSRGVNHAGEIRVVYAERMRVRAPSVMDAAEGALEDVDGDCRAGLLGEMSVAIEEAQKLLDEAFEGVNRTGLWMAGDARVPTEDVQRAIHEELLRAGAR